MSKLIKDVDGIIYEVREYEVLSAEEIDAKKAALQAALDELNTLTAAPVEEAVAPVEEPAVTAEPIADVGVAPEVPAQPESPVNPADPVTPVAEPVAQPVADVVQPAEVSAPISLN